MNEYEIAPAKSLLPRRGEMTQWTCPKFGIIPDIISTERNRV